MYQPAVIIVSVADIYKDHTFTSEVVTQAFMFEEVTILDTHNNWSRIEQWDGYKGWINNFHISFFLDQKVANLWVELKKNQLQINSLEHQYIGKKNTAPFTSKFQEVPFGAFDYHYNHQYLDKPVGGYEDECEDIIRLQILHDLNQLEGVPYKWGGKGSFGFDCSGLVQTVFKAQGILMPRDSKDQYELVKNNKIISLHSAAGSGDLIFFEENDKICHVGIYDKNLKFIHCSGMVKYNSLDKEDELFDKKLMDKFMGVFSISEIIKEQLNE